LQTQINKLTRNVRLYLRPRLRKHPNFHQFSINIHRKYCILTGFLHVLPDFYIIGSAKCGTSSLYEYLSYHPAVQPAVTKEVHFFDHYFERGLNWYKVCFPLKLDKFFVKNFGKKKFITGEASPRYIDHPHTPKRIKEITPDAKFIILLRNPIERAYSHYIMNVRQGIEPLSFEEAIDQQTKRTKDEFKKMEKAENYYSKPYFRFSYLERGIYISKLERWLKYFPKEQFCIIKSEDMFKDPNTIFNQILKFLELSPLKLNIYKQYRKGDYSKIKMTDDTKKHLYEFYKPYNQRLYKLLEKDLEWEKNEIF